MSGSYFDLMNIYGRYLLLDMDDLNNLVVDLDDFLNHRIPFQDETILNIRAFLPCATEFFGNMAWLMRNLSRLSDEDVSVQLQEDLTNFLGAYEMEKKKNGLPNSIVE